MHSRVVGLPSKSSHPWKPTRTPIFVEDPALVFGEAAILLRPGAPTRQGEKKEIEDALRRRFGRVLDMHEGCADGGDMLLTPAGMLIGLSSRTDRAGAAELARLLGQIGIGSPHSQHASGHPSPEVDCSLIAADQVLCTAALAAADIFNGYRKLVVPDGEQRAANSLRLNDTILVGDGFPQDDRAAAAGGICRQVVGDRG